VITNDGSWLNRGNAALLYSRVSALREFVPDAEFTIFTFQPGVRKDLQDVKISGVIASFRITRKAPYIISRTVFLLLNVDYGRH